MKLERDMMMGCWLVVSLRENDRGDGLVMVNYEDTDGDSDSGY